jgi:photosystem II stability/assembly factor-like uncharacterized protein
MKKLAALAGLLLALGHAAPAANLVDIATDNTDRTNREDAEPSVAVDPSNPRNISVIAMSGALGGGWLTGNNAIVWQSTDGGATWQPREIIVPPAQGRSGPHDQTIAYDSAGNLFVAALAEDLTNNFEVYI